MYDFDKKIIPVFIVPTGLGFEVGGHAGDANPAVKLLAAASDLLITHPNAVNASDINEMPENCWYVEGSILDKFLEHKVGLESVFYNRILLAVNAPVANDTINIVSAARMTLGADIEIIELTTPLVMKATILADGSASGIVTGWRDLLDQVGRYNFDVLAISTKIEVDIEVARFYVENGGVNPWGAVEAIASRAIADMLLKPVAHSPFGHTLDASFSEIVNPRMAAEFVSECYLHCVFKGLHRAPKIVRNDRGFLVREISCLISPVQCWGPPHKACYDTNIPIIMVAENKPSVTFSDGYTIPNSVILVDNYVEAAGMLVAMRAGIDIRTVRRPVYQTKVFREKKD